MPSGIHNGQRNHRKRHSRDVNPNWASGPAAAIPFALQARSNSTAFEDMVASLGVPEQFWHQDRRIAQWVHAHKNFRYVPEFLLEALGERVLDDGHPI